MAEIPLQRSPWQSEIDHWLEVQNTALNDVELAESRVSFAGRMIDNLLNAAGLTPTLPMD